MSSFRTLRALIVLALGAALIAGATGCRNIAEKAAQSAVEKATGVKVEEDGDKVTIQGEDGEMEISSKEGSLPSGWPDEAPLYDKAQISGSTSTKTGGQSYFTVSMTTDDPLDTVFDWWKGEFESKGWSIDNEMVFESDGVKTGSLVATKGDLNSTIWIAEEDDGSLAIAVQVTQSSE